MWEGGVCQGLLAGTAEGSGHEREEEEAGSTGGEGSATVCVASGHCEEVAVCNKSRTTTP